MAKVLVQGEGFSWTGDISERLPEEFDPGAVFPIQVLNDNLVHWHPGPQYSPVCGPHQSDYNPNIDVSARPGVGLLPLCCNIGLCIPSKQKESTTKKVN